MTGRLTEEEGAIPFVLVGVALIGGVLGLAWAGQEWAASLVHEAGGELTVWVLRGAFWALDLVALQASTAPVTRDWYTPVLEGPALPIYALAGLVMVATLIAEVVAGVATGNTPRIVQAVFRALVAGMLATVGASLLLGVGGALSELGRIALAASGTSVDAPLIPLQEALMDSALQRESGAELFIVFLAGLVVVFTALAIYFTLAMRPVLLAALIVFLPVAHALSVWSPLRRVQIRAWSLAGAVLLADAAILSMFAVTNTVAGQPEGIDRLIFGTFGLLLAALAPAALARIIGAPELQTAVQAMSTGSKAVAVGAGLAAAKGALLGVARTGRPRPAELAAGGGGPSALATAAGGGPPIGGGPAGPAPPPGGRPPGGDTPTPAGRPGAAPAGGGARAGRPGPATGGGGSGSGRAGSGPNGTTPSGAAGPASRPTRTGPARPPSGPAPPSPGTRGAGGWQSVLTRPPSGADRD